MGLFKKKQQHKFCPACGFQLKASDAFCTRCGYSFQERQKSLKKRAKWRNIIIFILLLALVYFGLRYANDLSIIPISIEDALNFKFK